MSIKSEGLIISAGMLVGDSMVRAGDLSSVASSSSDRLEQRSSLLPDAGVAAVVDAIDDSLLSLPLLLLVEISQELSVALKAVLGQRSVLGVDREADTLLLLLLEEVLLADSPGLRPVMRSSSAVLRTEGRSSADTVISPLQNKIIYI